MRKLISVLVVLTILMSVVSVSFVTTSAATEVLPFLETATKSKLLSGMMSKTLYKMDGSGTTKISKLTKKFNGSSCTPYLTQGAGTDGEDYYFSCAYKSDTNAEIGYIMKYDTSESKYYISGELPIAHGNDITYNPKLNAIMVANYLPTIDCVTLIDADNLTLIEQKPLKDKNGDPIKFYAMSYDGVNDRYVCFGKYEEADGYCYDYVLDGNFNEMYRYKRRDGLDEYDGAKQQYTNQGSFCTSEYILKPYSGHKTSDYNQVVVTDWYGNVIEYVTDKLKYELEDLFCIDGNYYFSYHNKSAGGYLYKIKMTNWITKYLPNGGTGTMDDSVHSQGVSNELSANKFTRVDHKFAGWYISRESDGKALYTNDGGTTNTWYTPGQQPSGYVRALFSDGQTVSDLAYDALDVVYCEAQWRECGIYTIKFDAGNGGTGSMNSIQAECGEALNLPANSFKKSGWTFDGWKAPDGTIYSDKASVKDLALKNQSVTLTAQWKGYKYYISFNKNSGSGSMSEITTYAGVDVTLPDSKFTRSKYTFVGWTVKRGSDSTYLYESADGKSSGWYKADKQPAGWNKKVIADGATVTDLEAKSGKTATLYAEWEYTAGSYTINFDGGDGATGTMSSVKANRDTSVTLPSNTFTKSGRTFAGWKAPDGTVYSNKASVKNLAPKGGSITLTAQWQGLKYYISFNKNSGSGSMSKITTYTGTEVTLPANKFTRSNYTFTGWTVKRGSDSTYLYESADGTASGWYKSGKQPSGWVKKVIADGATVLDLEVKSGKTATLYAQWVKN